MIVGLKLRRRESQKRLERILNVGKEIGKNQEYEKILHSNRILLFSVMGVEGMVRVLSRIENTLKEFKERIENEVMKTVTVYNSHT